MFAKAFVMTGLASVVSAHMLMSNPVPYNKATLNNAPLEPDGSNFPCKVPSGGSYSADGASNVYKQGSTQHLAFIGTAVHGGGSCQVSLTTDKNPSKNSVWKVIHSIEGGCPARNQAGNAPGNSPNAVDPDTYDFKIPDDLAAGEYTLAWTWFNKVGNREMYMNCAPVTVEGSGGSKDFPNSLPDMFVANIGGDCKTTEGTDLQFPKPGNSVAQDASNPALGPPECKGGNGGGSGGSSAPPSKPETSAPAPAPTAAPSAPSGIVPGGLFITVSGGSEPTQAPTKPETPKEPTPEPTPEQPATPKEPTPEKPTPVPGNGSGSGSSSGFAAGTACTSEGDWNCIGGSTFQRCASGAWTAAQPLSSGVTCTVGQGSGLKMVSKRGLNLMRRAMRIRV